MKLVVNDPETGKSFQIELDEEKSKALMGKKIGDVIDGVIADLPGYKLQITGGSTKEGFPMRPDFPGTRRERLLLSSGPGYRPLGKGIRKRKMVRGNTIAEDIAQVNSKIVEYGDKKLLEERFKKNEESQV
jgi:small subunit ribosomal protein S6e